MSLLCKTGRVIHRIVRRISRFRLLRLSALSIIDMHVKASDAPVTGVDSVGLLGGPLNPPEPDAPESGRGREPEAGFRAGGPTRPGLRFRSFRGRGRRSALGGADHPCRRSPRGAPPVAGGERTGFGRRPPLSETQALPFAGSPVSEGPVPFGCRSGAPPLGSVRSKEGSALPGSRPRTPATGSRRQDPIRLHPGAVLCPGCARGGGGSQGGFHGLEPGRLLEVSGSAASAVRYASFPGPAWPDTSFFAFFPVQRRGSSAQ